MIRRGHSPAKGVKHTSRQVQAPCIRWAVVSIRPESEKPQSFSCMGSTANGSDVCPTRTTLLHAPAAFVASIHRRNGSTFSRWKPRSEVGDVAQNYDAGWLWLAG